MFHWMDFGNAKSWLDKWLAVSMPKILPVIFGQVASQLGRKLKQYQTCSKTPTSNDSMYLSIYIYIHIYIYNTCVYVYIYISIYNHIYIYIVMIHIHIQSIRYIYTRIYTLYIQYNMYITYIIPPIQPWLSRSFSKRIAGRSKPHSTRKPWKFTPWDPRRRWRWGQKPRGSRWDSKV